MVASLFLMDHDNSQYCEGNISLRRGTLEPAGKFGIFYHHLDSRVQKKNTYCHKCDTSTHLCVKRRNNRGQIRNELLNELFV